MQMPGEDLTSYSESNQSQDYLNHTHDKFLEALLPDLEPNDVILDATCGNGLFAAGLLDRRALFTKLVLNDPSPRMFAAAQEYLPDDSRITFTAIPPEELEF